MATIVVSGRVDEAVKRRADMYIKAAGKTPAQIINDMYVQISITGELPRGDDDQGGLKERMALVEEFMSWRETLPPDDDWFNAMTDDDMHDLLGGRDA